MLGRRLSRKQIALSIGIGIVMVSILAAMTGSLTRDQLLVGTAAMTVVGLVMIWFFDRELGWSIPGATAEYLTIVGLFGFWNAVSDRALSWVVAIIFYWGLSTLVRRARRT